MKTAENWAVGKDLASQEKRHPRRKTCGQPRQFLTTWDRISSPQLAPYASPFRRGFTIPLLCSICGNLVRAAWNHPASKIARCLGHGSYVCSPEARLLAKYVL